MSITSKQPIIFAIQLATLHYRGTNRRITDKITTITVDRAPARCEQLEQTADAALELAVRQRDEDPQLIWNALENLERTDLQTLAAVLLAAVPIERPKSEIFAWVYELGKDSHS